MVFKPLYKLKRFVFAFPTYPFLFAIFPVLFLYSHNINELLLISIIRPLLTVVGITILVYISLNLLLKGLNKTALLVSIYLLLFFTYGHIKNLVGDFDIRVLGFGIGTDKTLTVLWIAVLFITTYLLIKTNKKLITATKFLNLISIILIGMSLANIFIFETKANRLFNLSQPNSEQETNSSTQLTKPEDPPSIYYLIFDRYASKRTLDNYYDYDTKDFFGYLEEKGFYIAENSHANYPATFLSLASSLNMKEVNYLSKEVGEESNDRTRVYEMIQDNKVQSLLKSIGYTYIHIGAWWQPTRVNKNADYNFRLHPQNLSNLDLDEFSTKLLETTMLPPILSIVLKTNEVESIWSRNNHRNMILYEFETIESVVDKFDDPKFVFAHILVPHAPYVLDERCIPLTEKEEKRSSREQNYLNHLDCANKKIKSVVDKILLESNNSAIIILQADEGPAPIITPFDSKWQLSSTKSIQEKTGILNAIYAPKVDKEILKPTMTPVNTFRTIFNYYFGANFKLLSDKVYVFENADHPYKLFDVTQKVK